MAPDIENVSMYLNMHLIEHPISTDIGAKIKFELKNPKYFEINNIDEKNNHLTF